MTEKTLTGAERQHLEIYGSALVRNRHLTLACVGLGLVIVGLIGLSYRLQAQVARVKPVIIRVDALGRHDVLDAEAMLTDAARLTVIRRDLRTFVVQHFARRHGAISHDFSDSLYFLEPSLREATLRATDPAVKAFITSPGAEELDITVKNVTLSELRQPPFKAQVDFEQQTYSPGTRAPRKKAETYVAQLDFVLRESVPNDYVQVNPLGLQITYLRVDQAFQ